jgi:hypothetical protein
MPDRVDLFDADIADSPAALSRLLDAWQPTDLGTQGRVVFAGLGSSRFAADVVVPHMRATGWSAWIELAGDETSSWSGWRPTCGAAPKHMTRRLDANYQARLTTATNAS